jgi:hypothetical protein
MIYLIYGSDQIKARRRFHTVVDLLVKKGGGSELFVVSPEDGTEVLENLLVGNSLFGNKYVVAADGLLATDKMAKVVTNHLGEMVESPHAFVLLEEAVNAEHLKMMTGVAFKIEFFETTTNNRGYNIFVLTDTWAERHKKNTWIKYQEALKAGMSEEEIFWKLVWQTKNLLLAKTSQDPQKLGLHPYALKKTIAYASKYTEPELKSKLSNLTDTYHRARRGELELVAGVEQLILEI